MNLSDSESKREIASDLQGLQEIVYTYRDQFGWKTLLQMVPVAGMIFGALTNRSKTDFRAHSRTYNDESSTLVPG
ncbi:EcsC family protein [Peribacillus simplex]|uniref:EcsC family protein n=1 Tax=Peribacillus simplex TaxID=1478 RepID=UPI003D29DAD4